MIEYELNDWVNCGTCFGEGVLFYRDGSIIGVTRDGHRYQIVCLHCKGGGKIHLEELELDNE